MPATYPAYPAAGPACSVPARDPLYCGGAEGSGSAPYVGPLDGLAVAPFAAYSLRRLLSAYEGPLVRLRRASDDEEDDFGYGVDGWLNVAGITSWLAGSTALITTAYDQIGSKNLTQGTAANQPALILSSATFNNRPVVDFDGSNDVLAFDNGAQMFSSIAAAMYMGISPDPENTYWDGCCAHITAPFGNGNQAGGAGLVLGQVGRNGASDSDKAQGRKSGTVTAYAAGYCPTNTASVFSIRGTATDLYAGVNGTEGAAAAATAAVSPWRFYWGSSSTSAINQALAPINGKSSEYLIFAEDIAAQHAATAAAMQDYWS